MIGSPAFTARELQREAEREVAMREHVYGKSGGSTGRTHAMADRRIAMMRFMAEHFKQIADREEGDLFNKPMERSDERG